MCLYHSVAINIEIHLLEVLDLNQINHVKIRETRHMGHKLTCGTNLTNLFQDVQNLILIYFFYNLVTYSGDLTLNKFDLGYKFDCVMCFVSVIVIRVH